MVFFNEPPPKIDISKLLIILIKQSTESKKRTGSFIGSNLPTHKILIFSDLFELSFLQNSLGLFMYFLIEYEEGIR